MPQNGAAKDDAHQDEMTDLKTDVAKGAGWIVAARFAVRMLGAVNTIIVARILAPADFGLVAIGVTAMQLLHGFSEVGVGQAVIRFRDAGRDDLNTLFTLSALRGIIVALLLVLAAPFAADIFDDPRVFWVFLGVALYPLTLGLMNPRFFEFERDLDFSKDFIVSAGNKLAGVAVSIAIAAAFQSYWAIILGLVTGGFVQLVLSYVLRPFAPRISFASFDKVFAFSGWLAGVSFMAALNNKLDALIVARALGEDDAGDYYIGLQLADLSTSELAGPIARAIYPGFSRLQQNAEAMRAAFLQGVEAMAAIALPAAIGFAFIADDFTALVLGAKWSEAAMVIAIVAPSVGLQTLFAATQYYAMAQDKTKYVFYRETAFFLFRTPIFIWAAVEYGLIGAAYACAVTSIVHCALNLGLYARLSGDAFWRPLWAARRSLFAAGVMTLYFTELRPLLSMLDAAPTLVRMLADIAFGGMVFIAAQTVHWRAAGAPSGVEQSIMDLARRFLEPKGQTLKAH